MTTPEPPRTLSSATTVAAAVLALLAGLNTGQSVLAWLFMFTQTTLHPGTNTPAERPETWLLLVGFVAEAVGCLLLLLGAIALFARAWAGRYLTAVGAVLAVGAQAERTVLLMSPDMMFGLAGFSLVGLGLPIAAAILALVPSTTVWLRAKPQ